MNGIPKNTDITFWILRKRNFIGYIHTHQVLYVCKCRSNRISVGCLVASLATTVIFGLHIEHVTKPLRMNEKTNKQTIN